MKHDLRRSSLEGLGRMTLGPTYGTAADVWELTKGNMDEYLAGRDTHAAAEAIRLGKSLMPIANVWWVQPMMDHGIMNALQENASPGYLARVQQPAQHDWGQGYWWRPNETTSGREPDVNIAFGD